MNKHFGLQCPRSINVLLMVILGTISLHAATYYIDYNAADDSSNGLTKGAPWKRCPGMVGFAGNYSHSAGDQFVFKGGVAWLADALPLTLGYSGSSGNVDSYTTNHTWYSGGSWTQPTFNGEHVENSLVIAYAKSYFTFNDMKLIDAGTAQTSNSKKAVDIQNGSNYTISNNTIAGESWLGLYLYSASSGTYSNITVSGNDISHSAQAIVVATAAANTIIDNVDLNGNHIHDLASQIGGGVHGDGIHVWGVVGDNTQYVANMKIRNNRFSGSFIRTFGVDGAMTAWIYVADATEGVIIYNNVGSYSDPATASMFEALISLRGNSGRGGRHKVFSNTLVGKSPGISAGILMGDGTGNAVPNCEFKNNILTGMQYGMLITSGSETGLVCDYNCINSVSDVAYYLTGFKSLAAFKALGYMTHGLQSDPVLTSATDFSLKSTSPCKDFGISLGSMWASDANGVLRPQGSGWDIGALEVAESLKAVTTPLGLRIVTQ